MVDIATVFVDWLDAGLFAQLTQCGRIDVFPVIDESCRQTVAKASQPTRYSRSTKYKSCAQSCTSMTTQGACRITCLRITVLSAVSCLQRDTHVLHAENRAFDTRALC